MSKNYFLQSNYHIEPNSMPLPSTLTYNVQELYWLVQNKLLIYIILLFLMSNSIQKSLCSPKEMQSHVVFLPLFLSYPPSLPFLLCSLFRCLSLHVFFSSLFHCFCLLILLSFLPFLQQKQSGYGTICRYIEINFFLRFILFCFDLRLLVL